MYLIQSSVVTGTVFFCLWGQVFLPLLHPFKRLVFPLTEGYLNLLTLKLAWLHDRRYTVFGVRRHK